MMSAIRTQWDDAVWFNFYPTTSPSSHISLKAQNKIRISNQSAATTYTATDVYPVGTRLKVNNANVNKYGSVISLSSSSTAVILTMTMDSGTLTSTITSVSRSIITPGSSGSPLPTTFSVVIQVFTSSGTYTPTANMKYCIIECIGGGGGGGGAATTGAGDTAGAGGGGSGGYSRKVSTASAIGASQTVTIGAAGAAGAAGANNGGAGGDTSVGTICIGKGGSGGLGATAGTGNIGGLGGVAGTGDVTATGGAGHLGIGNTGIGANLAPWGGAGGASPFGGGGQGSTGTAAGQAGALYGGGGAGGTTTNGAQTAGGAGAAGIAIVTEYIEA